MKTKIIYMLMIIGCSTGLMADSPCEQPHDWRCEHGAIVMRDHNRVKKGVVEHVTLYPKSGTQSDNTIERDGILMRYPEALGTILICHGFMCDKFDVGFLRRIFPKRKFNIMTFDFRAHGDKRDGQFCTFGKDEALDVFAAAKFLRNHPELKDKPLFAYGFSMGAVAAIEAQAQFPALFDAMILDCPFDSSKNLIRNGLNNMRVNLFGYQIDIPGRSTLEKYAFHPYMQLFLKTLLKAISKMDSKNVLTNISLVAPAQSIKNITVPCFFIHCKNDELVPVNAITKIFTRAPGYKTLWITDGRRHFDSLFFNPERYALKIKTFLKNAAHNQLDDTLNGVVIEDIDNKEIIKKNEDKKGECNGMGCPIVV